MLDRYDWIEKGLYIFLALFFVAVFAVIGTAVAFSVANESNRISEGVAIDKDYRAAHTTHNYIKSGEALIPVPQNHPETYHIKLQGEKDGEAVAYWREVTAQEYRTYDIGDYYPEEDEDA